MAEKTNQKNIRWTWNTGELRWERTKNEKAIIKKEQDFTSREGDTSDRNIMKQYKWILDQGYDLDSPLRTKNTLVKRIPALGKDTALKTRNSVDGRLRSIFKKIEDVIKDNPKANITMPAKLEWFRPSKSQKNDTAKKKLKNDILSIFGS